MLAGRIEPAHRCAMVRDPDAHPVLGPLLADPPEECRAVAELYRHCAQGVALEEILGDRRGGAFF
ncbi:MAG: hypothetical protein H0T96_05195, partial [Thermoleophilaceae bacterium]|nr:hypothetical protein [Thermoleophilaceae bacterium]